MRVASALSALAGELSSVSSVEELERRYTEVTTRILPWGVGFYLLDPDTHAVLRMRATRVSDFFLARYEEVGRRCDPLLRSIDDGAAVASVGTTISPEGWLEHPLYTEVNYLHEHTRLMEAPILCAGQIAGTLYFAGSDATPPMGAADLAIAESFGRIVGMALWAMRRTEELERERDNARAVLELSRQPTITTDLKNGRRSITEAAQALLEEVAWDRDGSLIDALMARQAPGARGTSEATLEVALRDGGTGRLGARSLRVPNDPLTMVSFLTLERDRAAALPPYVTAVLTPREREVAALAADGLRDAEIAARLVISPHTVNQHLKSVYAKLGISRRLDLARLCGPSSLG